LRFSQRHEKDEVKTRISIPYQLGTLLGSLYEKTFKFRRGTMFWKKIEHKKDSVGADSQNGKILTPRRIIVHDVEKILDGEFLTYQLPKVYWGGLGGYAIVELNREYPKQGKKYIISVDNMGENKPAGKKKKLWASNKPKEIAAWILEKGGTRLN